MEVLYNLTLEGENKMNSAGQPLYEKEYYMY